MTRIIAGSWGGRRLAVPRSGVRPTSDRVREAVFSRLDHLIADWAAVSVLDLYAGSGALGLEAVSRGAGAAVLVEREPAAVRTIRRNVADLGADSSVEVRVGDVLRVAATGCDQPARLVLADPPYAAAAELPQVLAAYRAGGWIAPGALIVAETGARGAAPWPPGFVADGSRRYGDTAVWYGRLATADTPEEQD